MRVTRVLHASVNVEGRLDDAVRFYAEVFDLPSDERPEIPFVGGHWFRAGAQIHLVDAPMAGSGIDPTGPHFCLGVEDLEGAVAELEARGIEYFRATQPGVGAAAGTEVTQVWIVDPAGNTIELQQDHPDAERAG